VFGGRSYSELRPEANKDKSMNKIPQRPTGKSDNNIIVPLIAAVAITVALAAGWMMMSDGDRNNQAGMTTQSSSTGASSGEAGQNTIRDNQDIRPNPGAAAAPTKTPDVRQTNP
jgi:hypothetical protein